MATSAVINALALANSLIPVLGNLIGGLRSVLANRGDKTDAEIDAEINRLLDSTDLGWQEVIATARREQGK